MDTPRAKPPAPRPEPRAARLRVKVMAGEMGIRRISAVQGLVLCAVLLMAVPASAAIRAKLVKDIAPGRASSDPTEFNAGQG